jgi:hypothetical protein
MLFVSQSSYWSMVPLPQSVAVFDGTEPNCALVTVEFAALVFGRATPQIANSLKSSQNGWP